MLSTDNALSLCCFCVWVSFPLVIGLPVSEGVRVFTHMVSCDHEEALNYMFKHKRAKKSLSDVDRGAQWFTVEYLINQISIKADCGVATHKGPNICTHYRS